MIYTAKVREHLIAANVNEACGEGETVRPYLMAAVRLPLETDLDDQNNYPPCYVSSWRTGDHEVEVCEHCVASNAVRVMTSLEFFGFAHLPQEHLENTAVEW